MRGWRSGGGWRPTGNDLLELVLVLALIMLAGPLVEDMVESRREAPQSARCEAVR